MKTKFTSTLFLFFLFVVAAQAQDALAANKTEGLPKNTVREVPSIPTKPAGMSVELFSFNRYTSENTSNSNQDIEALLNEKLQVLNNTYTYTTPIAPGNPGLKTVVRKPVIYSVVMKLEKFYRKEIKEGRLDEEEARLAFLKTIDVALSAFYCDTEKFESTIKSTKDIRVVAQIFQQAIVY
jgi:hypothetical protein